MAGLGRGAGQPVGPFGLFGGGPIDAAHEEGLRIVRGVLVGIGDLQARFFLKNAMERSHESFAAASW